MPNNMGLFTKSKKKQDEATQPAAPVEHTHDHHDHADHVHEADAPIVRRPEPAKSAVGIGATSYILRPIITEKAAHAGAHRTYIFAVRPQASKGAIREAIEKIYGVRVTNVRTSRFDGKKVRIGRTQGQRSAWKKAFVTVAAGQSITIA